MTAPRRQVRRSPTSVADELAVLLPVLLVLVGGWWFAGRHGAEAADLTRSSVLLLATQTLPGLLVWRSVRPVSGWLVEDLVLGTAVGAALTVPGHVLAVALDQRWTAWVVPASVALLLLVVPGSRARILRAEWYRLPLWWGWAVGLAATASLALVGRVFSQPLPGRAAWATQPMDVAHHLAVGAEVQRRFPPEAPWFFGHDLGEPWFAHAWLGALAGLPGAPPDVLLTRWAPVLLGVLAVAGLACLALRLGGPGAGALAAAGVVLVRELPGVEDWTRIPLFTPAEPGTGFAVFIATAVVALLAVRRRALPLVLMLVLLAVVVGSLPGPGEVVDLLLPLGVAAALAALGRLSRPETGRRRTWLLAALGAALGWLFVGPLHDVVRDEAVVLVLALLVLGFGLRGSHRRAREVVLVAGVAAAASVSVLSLLATEPFQGPVVVASGPAYDAAGRPAGLGPVNGGISADQWRAMRWIAAHADVDDVVMTNAHCWNKECSDARPWLAAYSGRRVVADGTGRTDEPKERALVLLNDLVYSTSSQAVLPAFHARGVRWIYAVRGDGVLRRLDPVAERVYTGEDAVVYRLRPRS